MSSLLKTVVATAAAVMVGVPLSIGSAAALQAEAAPALAATSAAASKSKLDTTYTQLSDQAALGARTGSLSGLKDNGEILYTQNSLIYDHDSWPVGVPIKQGPILNAYAQQGYEHGWLGYPITQETTRYGGTVQEFEGGWVRVDSAGAVTTGGGRFGSDITDYGTASSNVGANYTNQGAAGGRLGQQTTGINCGIIRGGCWAAFTGGEIWTSTYTQGSVTDWRIIDAYGKTGYENGWLGYPVMDSSSGKGNPAGGSYVNFEHGSITVNAGGQVTVSQALYNVGLPGDEGCSYAQTGDNPYRDSVCWIDMSKFNEAQARSTAGQDMTLNLDGGYVAKFKFKIRDASGRKRAPVSSLPVPTYYAAGIGNTGFGSIAGQPALLFHGQQGSGVSMRIDSITVTDPTGAPVPDYAFVTGDSESTEAGETVMFRSDKTLTKLASLQGGTGRGCDDTRTQTTGLLVTCTGPAGGTMHQVNGPFWPFMQYDVQKSGNILYYSYAPGYIDQEIRADTPNGAIFGFLVTKASATVQAPSDARGDDPKFTASVSSGSNSASVDAAPGETQSTENKVFLNGSDLKFRINPTGTSPAWYKYQWTCMRNGKADASLTADAGDSNELTVKRSKINFGDQITCSALVQLRPVTFEMKDRYWRQ